MHHCPVCETDVPGFEGGPAGRCPSCTARGRFRLLWLWYARETDILTRPVRVLHVAPERALQRRFREIAQWDYVTTDLEKPDVTLHMDITDIFFRDRVFDVVMFNHVLEHVVDDRAALAELFRVLKPGGWMMLTVPMDRTAAETRLLYPDRPLGSLGPHEHKRFYGWDLVDMLEETGFAVRTERYVERFTAGDRARYGIKGDILFLCTRPEAQ